MYQVHTQIDSSSSSDGLVEFRVIAGMEEGNFDSETVSGYSIDNISPSAPTGFEGEFNITHLVFLEIAFFSFLEVNLNLSSSVHLTIFGFPPASKTISGYDTQ